ncbi:MAG: NUDIX domain-containing protein [Planctomycetes bacterium]|nr:NUDIX domain-containing protein [Planctomycetota bacterium]
MIVSADHRHCLLTHHRKLGRWLQLGGHADGDPRIDEVVLREAREESGMVHFDLFRPGGALVPYDVDVHVIPARGSEPAHEHHDLRFLLVAGAGQELVVSDESHDLAWVPIAELERYTDEDSVLRLRRKLPW